MGEGGKEEAVAVKFNFEWRTDGVADQKSVFSLRLRVASFGHDGKSPGNPA
jgi:hypothetical protein